MYDRTGNSAGVTWPCGNAARSIRNLPGDPREPSLLVMSPRSLLFSSDPGTSRLLNQALGELELQVESCEEIFAALKSLTSRAFDLVVVDWDEGLEASFLLKTARELKSNRGAFAIVIGRAEASAALEQAGADLVLSKPVHPDRVRHALLSSNEFMSHLKPRLALGQERPTAIPGTGTGAWSTPVPEREPAALAPAPPLDSLTGGSGTVEIRGPGRGPRSAVSAAEIFSAQRAESAAYPTSDRRPQYGVPAGGGDGGGFLRGGLRVQPTPHQGGPLGGTDFPRHLGKDARLVRRA